MICTTVSLVVDTAGWMIQGGVEFHNSFNREFHNSFKGKLKGNFDGKFNWLNLYVSRGKHTRGI